MREMIHFAESTTSIPNTVVGLMGLVITTLVGVVVYLNRKLDQKDTKLDQKNERIEELQDARLDDSKQVTKDVTTVLQGNSQSNLVLAEKIEAAKRSQR